MKLYDKIVVVDVESTCWEGTTPEGQISEIIEIGICTLDLNSGKIEDAEGVIVKPKDSEVSAFCTELTTITPELVAGGIDFEEACSYINAKYRTFERVWASYGAYDQTMFEKQCSRRQVKYPFSHKHLNVKTLFALKQRLPREVGMAGALKTLEIPLEGTHHRGVDDAKNIAKILRHILK